MVKKTQCLLIILFLQAISNAWAVNYSPARLFGYQEIKKQDLSLFPQWLSVLERHLLNIEDSGSCQSATFNRCHLREWQSFLQGIRHLVADEQIVAQDGNSFFQPRSDETIESIRSLVTSALSLNPGRGDAINIIKVPNQAVQDDSPPQQISLFYEISNLIPIGKITFFSIVFLLFYFLILKPVLALLHRDIEQASGDKEDRDEENVVKAHTEDEQIDMAAALKKEIENDPIGAAHVIKKWIQET